ncbi:hypothetical protein N7G274_002171 [Stereocaulon virgatum]|uniref:Uncharacterized protein n=1 Tax=Stereocaulon virgatum TaxID=373712 RepID=A0ABR4AIZ9_9LECA
MKCNPNTLSSRVMPSSIDFKELEPVYSTAASISSLRDGLLLSIWLLPQVSYNAFERRHGEVKDLSTYLNSTIIAYTRGANGDQVLCCLTSYSIEACRDS